MNTHKRSVAIAAWQGLRAGGSGGWPLLLPLCPLLQRRAAVGQGVIMLLPFPFSERSCIVWFGFATGAINKNVSPAVRESRSSPQG